jgi:hypothetical protein
MAIRADRSSRTNDRPHNPPYLDSDNLKFAVRLGETVCALAGPPHFLSDVKVSARANGLPSAVARRDTPLLFEWIARAASFQGISDSVARNYITQVRASEMERHCIGLGAASIMSKA